MIGVAGRQRVGGKYSLVRVRKYGVQGKEIIMTINVRFFLKNSCFGFLPFIVPSPVVCIVVAVSGVQQLQSKQPHTPGVCHYRHLRRRHLRRRSLCSLCV